jgi:DNA-binding CsgD family transcriptional regulator/tetratricopeptide (TPR) repeat protein
MSANLRNDPPPGIGRSHPYRRSTVGKCREPRGNVRDVELLEREAAFDLLTDALTAAQEGNGRLALVSAEAGGGKTSLLQAFAESTGTRVLWGGCDDLVTPIPFSPLLDLARSSDPGLESALLEGERDRAFTRLLDLLERKPHPVLVVIDDVQWIDQASADTLSAIAQRVDRLPVLLVFTARPEGLGPDHPALRMMWRSPNAVRIDLEPLSIDAVSTLTDQRTAEEIVRTTGGNPFFVNQLLESGGLLTPTVADSVRSRAASLPAETIELLELISINPARAEGTLLDLTSPGWETRIEQAELMRLVDVRPDSVAFRHDLARRAFESGLSASRRRAFHGRVLEAVLELGYTPARIVHHAEGAGASQVILTVGPQAVERARKAGSHREAAAHLKRILFHADLLDPVRLAETEEAYSLEAWTINQPAEAEAASRRALELRRTHGGPLEAIGMNLRRIARARWFVGDASTAVSLLDESIEALGQPTSVAEREELISTLAYRGLIAGIRGTFEDARPWIDQALDLLADESETALAAFVFNHVGTLDYLHRGDPTRLLASVRLAEQLAIHTDAVRGHVNLASCALTYRDYGAASDHLRDAEHYAASHQVFAFQGLAEAIRAQILFETGDWDLAIEAAESAIAHGSFASLPASIVRSRLKVRRGDTDAAEAMAEALQAAWSTGEAQRIIPATGAAAEHAWLQDRLSDVADAIEEAHALAVRTGSPRWIGETSIWMQAAGRLAEIPPEAETVARLMVEGSWQEAAREWDRIRGPYEAAVCRALADDAETVMLGLGELDQLGAVPMARRTRNRLARMGVEKIPRGPRRSTAANPAGLTARQMDVLGLVVDGFTNAEIAERLFLSARTVDHHVAAILLKLEVESRRHVRDRAAELGILEG